MTAPRHAPSHPPAALASRAPRARRATLALAALGAAACTASRPPHHSSGPVDAGPAPDGGSGPAVVCARAAAASPFDALAFGLDGRSLVTIGADGARATRHRVFGDAALREPPTLRSSDAGGGRYAAVVHGTPACDAPPCRRAVLVVVDEAGAREIPLGPADDRSPWLRNVTEDGALVVGQRGPDGTPRVTLVDPRGAGTTPLPRGVHPRGAFTADAGGWRNVGVEPDAAPFIARPAFWRSTDGAVRHVPGAPADAVAVEGRWAWVDGAPASPAVVWAEPDGARRIPLPPELADARASTARDGQLVLVAGQAPAAVVDVTRGRVIRWSTEAWDDALAAPGVGLGDGWLFTAAGGVPVHRVHLATGTVEPVPWPDGAAPLPAAYCTPPPVPLPDGSVAVGLRAADGTAGLHRVGGETRAPIRIGAPLFDVLVAQGLRVGGAWVVHGVSGERTFCPTRAPWEGTPPDGALVGDSLQLVGPDGWTVRVPEDEQLLQVDPTGTCALLAHGEASPRLGLVDLETGARRDVDRPAFLLPVPPTRLGPF